MQHIVVLLQQKPVVIRLLSLQCDNVILGLSSHSGHYPPQSIPVPK